ncbi:MAG: ribonucleotide-diphosphate reductase subunit beta [Pseudomonas sp.]|nr:ribonucleotide-diphosphate reductase subunit beta [Pseudomonas sp.]
MNQLTTFNLTYKPFAFPWAMEIASKHEDIHWTEKEADLQDDVTQWNNGTLTQGEKNHITQILRLFTTSDVQVGGNYCDFFIPYFRNNELRNMLLAFAAREGIHQRAYALLNETLGLDDSEFSAFLEFEEMADKAAFSGTNSAETPKDMALSLVKSVINEGLCLFSAFAQLLTYKRSGKMLGMSKIVEWSIRDETEHVNGMARLFREFVKAYPEVLTEDFKKAAYDMFREAVALEDRFIDLCYEQGEPPKLSKEELKAYIRYIADRRLVALGFKPNWELKENPSPWIEEILGDQLTNFFEQRVSDYSVGNLTGEWVYPDVKKGVLLA